MPSLMPVDPMCRICHVRHKQSTDGLCRTCHNRQGLTAPVANAVNVLRLFIRRAAHEELQRSGPVRTDMIERNEAASNALDLLVESLRN